jgi:hypothetical protein
VATLVDEGREIGEAGPQREVYEDEIVLVGTQGCGVSFWCLQAPDKAWTVVGESVDGIQLLHEPGHQWISERSQHPSDVDLRQMIHDFVPFSS